MVMVKSKNILSRGNHMYKFTLTRQNMASLRDGCKASVARPEEMRGSVA